MNRRVELQNPIFNSTTMVQEIVAVLKNPPFNETMTLLSFEEKKEIELLELIVRVMGMIDPTLKLDKNDTAESIKVLFEFLKIINFQYSSERYALISFNLNRQLQEDLSNGDKRLLIQILHLLLTKLEELKKKYYQNKHTNNIQVSDEFRGDDEILELMANYKALQAEFQQTYQMLEETRQNAPVSLYSNNDLH